LLWRRRCVCIRIYSCLLCRVGVKALYKMDGLYVLSVICIFCIYSSLACKDNPKYSSRCNTWKVNYCNGIGAIYYSFMYKNCRKSCGWCDASLHCAPGPPPTARLAKRSLVGSVVGGSETKPNYWPWQVTIWLSGKHHCGGTLISPGWVMTAAHCLDERNVTKYKAIFGEHHLKVKSNLEQTRRITKMILHPSFNYAAGGDDIALLKVDIPVVLNKVVKFACLPKQTKEERSVGKECYITGWGTVYEDYEKKKPEVLHSVKLPVVTTKACAKINFRHHKTKIRPDVICAGYGWDYDYIQSGCHGDSGGPLACKINHKWTVEGVVSWGSSSCFGFEKYTVFTRVSSYRTWIDRNIGYYWE